MNIAILVFFSLTTSAIAQTRSDLQAPTPQEQREAIARLRANLAAYEQQAPDLVCRQPSLNLNGSEVAQGSLNPRVIVFPERTPQQHAQAHGLVKSFAIAPVIHDLLPREAQVSFVRWASVAWSPKTGRTLAAVYRYERESSDGIKQQTEVYADLESGRIFQIVFHGINTPEGASLSCQNEGKASN
jgi:hypothetical protein